MNVADGVALVQSYLTLSNQLKRKLRINFELRRSFSTFQYLGGLDKKTSDLRSLNN